MDALGRQRLSSVLQQTALHLESIAYVPSAPDLRLREMLREIGGEAGELSSALYSFWQLEEARNAVLSGKWQCSNGCAAFSSIG